MNLRTFSILLSAAVLLLFATACDQEPLADGQPDGEVTCTSCHGTPGGETLNDSAPPVSTEDGVSSQLREVGAHQAHLMGGTLFEAVDCTECHEVPTIDDWSDHLDPAPAELTWGPLATAHGAVPQWNQDDLSCSNVYCHGATLAGGSNTTPSWILVNGSQDACGTCHGAPPPAPHSQSDDCSGCHASTVQEDGTIDVAGGFHINGRVDVEAGCTSCHGSDGDPAPPNGLNGETETTTLAVGAHQAHLIGGVVAQGVACSECHINPPDMLAEGHLDAAPADLTWGELASAHGADPMWNRGEATCTNVYCHGATLAGGTNTEPEWTNVGADEAACGACHGNPPPAPHPQNSACAACHGASMGDDHLPDVAAGLHINGTVDVELGCNSCHGSEDNAAPPAALDGSTETTVRAVGAHQAHLQGGGVSGIPIACGECHTVPDTLNAAGHLDDAPAEVVWGALATGNGALTPEWDPATETCTNVYCHGAGMVGGSNVEPVWTEGSSQASCGTCHSLAPHDPPRGACNNCHGASVDENMGIIEDGEHVDGKVF